MSFVSCVPSHCNFAFCNHIDDLQAGCNTKVCGTSIPINTDTTVDGAAGCGAACGQNL